MTGRKQSINGRMPFRSTQLNQHCISDLASSFFSLSLLFLCPSQFANEAVTAALSTIFPLTYHHHNATQRHLHGRNAYPATIRQEAEDQEAR
jgi:hypothetical protein